MKKIILLILVMVVAAMPYGKKYVRLSNTRSESAGYPWTRCYYSNYSWNVAIVVRGLCPYRIKYYPQTGNWTK